MNTISYQPRCHRERFPRWRLLLCWFPTTGMSILSVMWFVYVLHLWGALPTAVDDGVFAIGRFLGATIAEQPSDCIHLGIARSTPTRLEALQHAISLAPFAFGMPFILIVRAVRQQEAEAMRALEDRN